LFDRILIANRGEIACRIIRTCRRLGIGTVAVYSEADRKGLHVAMADEAYPLGRPDPRHSYLLGERILEAAALGAADAIHPGCGFLAENGDFAQATADAGFVFIGPPPDAIRTMGEKGEAKAILEANGVPTLPGYHGSAQDMATLAREAERVGYPLLLKPVAGGGGKGMHGVTDRRDLEAAAARARREAEAAFGDGRLLIEKYLPRPRHVEVQVFADRFGTVVALHERDCSLQRRHQKIIEEAPAPGIKLALRRRLAEAAVTAARAVGYENAGTVEFLLDDDGRFYFLEMNTRLQVEHPVTEMIIGQDLVEWQLRVAAGEPLPLSQDDIPLLGHAFEARLYAEEPARDFLPAAGTLRHLRFPEDGPHVRIDSGVREGDALGTWYDPLIAKLVVWDGDRERALLRLRRALDRVQVVGPKTNLAFLAAVAGHPAFALGDVDTRFIERHRHDLLPEPLPASPRFLALATLDVLKRREAEARAQAARSTDPHSPWQLTDGWRLNEDNHHRLVFLEGDDRREVVVHFRGAGYLFDVPGGEGKLAASGELDDAGDLLADLGGVRLKATVVRDEGRITVIAGGASHTLTLDDPAARAGEREVRPGSLKAPMPGRVIAVSARSGDQVARGETLMVVEAMKMEHAITAPADGTVARVHFTIGDQVEEGALLISFAETDGAPPADD
jgi:3-methylcrotonyl-CoA carboxylase alpha subunit